MHAPDTLRSEGEDCITEWVPAEKPGEFFLVMVLPKSRVSTPWWEKAAEGYCQNTERMIAGTCPHSLLGWELKSADFRED